MKISSKIRPLFDSYKPLLLAAGVLFVMAFTLSCSSDDGGSQDGGDKGNDISNYKTVVIGAQTWMAENLNYAVAGSKCNSNDPANCTKYGRLYDWPTAMALPSSCNENSCSSQIQPKHRGICPSGWHIPSNDDWDRLFRFVDSVNDGEGEGIPYESYTAGKYLKTSDWGGTNKYGFSALPGGNGYSDGSFSYVGDGGYWWSAHEYSSLSAYYRIMYYSNYGAYWSSYFKSRLFSVRCVQD